MSCGLFGAVSRLYVRRSGLSVAFLPLLQRSRVFGFVPELFPPSQVGHPIEHPFENQKHDCPASHGT